MSFSQTIPDHVLDKIVADRPHLGGIVGNLRALPSQAPQFEKPLAIAYLGGATKSLAPLDLLALSKCTVGERFGGGAR